jgi:hypothetical protein
MGKSFWIANESETFGEGIESHFRAVFWYDDLGVLRDLGCAPMEWFKSQLHTDVNGFYELRIPPKEFEAWFDDCRSRLISRKDQLPTLYQIWEEERQGGQIGSSGYVMHGGEIFQVSADRDKFTLARLDTNHPGNQRQLQSLTYSLPDTSLLPTPLKLIPTKGEANDMALRNICLTQPHSMPCLGIHP